MTKRELKMWLAVRQDIKLSKGKLAAQAGHGFGRLYMRAMMAIPDTLTVYLNDNEPKIVVKAKNAEMVQRIVAEASTANICHEVIADAGRSEVEPGTITVVAFGPAYFDELPKFLQRLQVMRDDEEAAPPPSE